MFPSDEAIVAAVREELRHADMNNTTVKSIRAAVSAKLGVDLTEKKDFVKQTVDRLLAEQLAADASASASASAPAATAATEASSNSTNTSGENAKAETTASAASAGDSAASDMLWNSVVPRRQAAPLPKAIKPTKAKKEAKSSSASPGGEKRKTGFQALCSLSPALAAFMGVPEMTRSDATKRLWDYVKTNDLPRDSKGKVLLDKKLQDIFQRKTLTFATVSAALKRHMTQAYNDDN